MIQWSEDGDYKYIYIYTGRSFYSIYKNIIYVKYGNKARIYNTFRISPQAIITESSIT